MPPGGRRIGSGPAPDPNSERSEKKGLSFKALPASYSGGAPDWPLPPRTVMKNIIEDGKQHRVVDPERTAAIAAREAELWAWVWTSPQANAWAQPSEHWRWHTVALWCRTAAICESHEATAADKTALHRLADESGFSTGGLRANGWIIAHDELAAKAAQLAGEDLPPASGSERRLRGVQ